MALSLQVLKRIKNIIRFTRDEKKRAPKPKNLIKPNSQAKNVVLHVGTDKTGSTAIQSILSANQEQLSRLGCFYPESGRNKQHHHGGLFDALQMDEYGLWNRLHVELSENEKHLGILSFEGFYHLPVPSLNKAVELLRDFNLYVVIYLRRQSDMVCSGLAQRVKQGTNIITAGYVYEDLLAIAQDYRPVLDKFVNVFGEDRVIVKVYEDSAFKDGELFIDFLSSFGINVSKDYFFNNFIISKNDPNPSLDVEGMYILELFDRLKVSGEIRNAVRNYLLWYGSNDKSTTVRSGWARQIDEHFLYGNSSIAKRWLGKDQLFETQSRFAYREPDHERVNAYLEAIWKFVPLTEMPCWGGNKNTFMHFKHVGRLITQADCKEGLVVSCEPVEITVRIGGRQDVELSFFYDCDEQAKVIAEVNGTALDVVTREDSLNIHVPNHVFFYCAGVLRLKIWCDCAEGSHRRLTEMAFTRL